MAASQRTFGAYRDLAAVSGIPYAGLAGGVADYAAAASLSTSGGGRWERMLLPPRALDRISIGTPVPILGGSVSLGLAYVKPAQGRTNRIENVSYGEEGDARERADSSGCATIRGGASMVAAATPMAASRTELSTAGSMPSTTARWRRSSQCRRGDLRLGEPRPHHPFRTSLRGQREREATRLFCKDFRFEGPHKPVKHRYGSRRRCQPPRGSGEPRKRTNRDRQCNSQRRI